MTLKETDKRNRAKEIEKILRYMCPWFSDGICRGEIRCHDDCIKRSFAKDAVNELIPEGSVVLTKEEYEDIQAQIAYLREELGKLLRGDNVSVSAREYGQLLYANENAQKEIDKAVEERTIAIIKDIVGHRFAYYMKDETNGTVSCYADYVVDEDDVKFLEEKYKVEAWK